MSDNTKMWVRFAVGVYLAYLGVAGLTRSGLTTGDVVLHAIQLLVAVYAVGTGVSAYRHRDDPPPPPLELDDALRGEVEVLVGKGEEVRAIKLVRERTGAALLPARDAVTAVAANAKD